MQKRMELSPYRIFQLDYLCTHTVNFDYFVIELTVETMFVILYNNTDIEVFYPKIFGLSEKSRILLRF